MSFNKSSWGWSRTGHPASPELNALFWQIGDFSACEWTFDLLNCWYKDRHLSFFWALDKKEEVIISIRKSTLSNLQQEKMSTSCTELWIQNLEKSKVLQIPHLLQEASMYSVLTSVDPMLRLQFNVNIFRVVIPVKKKSHLCLLLASNFSSFYSFILQSSSVMLMSLSLWKSKLLKEWETLRWVLPLTKLPQRTRLIGTFFLCHRESHEWCEKAGLSSWSWTYICIMIPAQRTRIISNNNNHNPRRGDFYCCTLFCSSGMV